MESGHQPTAGGFLYSSLCAHIMNRRTGRIAPALSLRFVEAFWRRRHADSYHGANGPTSKASAEAAAPQRRLKVTELDRLWKSELSVRKIESVQMYHPHPPPPHPPRPPPSLAAFLADKHFNLIDDQGACARVRVHRPAFI